MTVDNFAQSAWGVKHFSKLGDFIGRVHLAWFSINYERDPETLIEYWQCEVLEILQEDYEGTLVPDENGMVTQTLEFKIGKGWYSPDGETAQSDQYKRFMPGSVAGRVVMATAGTTSGYGPAVTRVDGQELVCDFGETVEYQDGQGNTLYTTELAAHLASQGRAPNQASCFQGLTFQFARCEVDYGPDRKRKEELESEAAEAREAGDDEKAAELAEEAESVRMIGKPILPVRWVKDDDDTTPAPAEEEAKPAAKPAKQAAAKKAASGKQAAQAAVAAAKAKAQPTSGNPFAELVDDAELAGTLNAVFTQAEDYSAYIDGVVASLEKVGRDGDADLLNALLDAESGPWSTRT